MQELQHYLAMLLRAHLVLLFANYEFYQQERQQIS